MNNGKRPIESAFERYAAAIELSPTAEITGRIDKAAASAYVWGWQDARGDEKNTEVASTFGYLYGEAAALYAAEKLSSKDNIAVAWSRYQEFGEVLTTEQRDQAARARH